MSAITKKSIGNKTGNWRSRKPVVTKKCIGCATCASVCPDGAIRIKDVDGKKNAVINYDFCKGCLICKDVCPVKAIEEVRE
jgi:pyruvate ferredoxin oxidoreductase delta subunit